MALVNFAPHTYPVPPLNPPLPAYPFAQFEHYTDEGLLTVLSDFIVGNLDANFPIQPLQFTHYTIDQLRVRYQLTANNFRPLYFFHYWGPHPLYQNKDMAQRWPRDPALERCYWKHHGRSMMRHGTAVRTTYKLYYGRNEAVQDTTRGYGLVEYRFHPEFYGDAAAVQDPELQHSDWAIVKLVRGELPAPV